MHLIIWNINFSFGSYLWRPEPDNQPGTPPAPVSRSPWSRLLLFPCHESKPTDAAVRTADLALMSISSYYLNDKHSTPSPPPPKLLLLPCLWTPTFLRAIANCLHPKFRFLWQLQRLWGFVFFFSKNDYSSGSQIAGDKLRAQRWTWCWFLIQI